MGESGSMTMTSGRPSRTSGASENGGVRPRLVASLILGIITLPVIVIGLIDPLEGGLALLVALGLAIAVRLLSGVPVPRLAWVSFAATLAVGALALVLAVIGMPSDVGQQVGPDVTAPNPVNAGVRILVWVYRVGVLVLLVGGVVYLVRIARAVRGTAHAPSEESRGEESRT